MKILAIDAATEACSAALFIDDEVTHEFQLAPREHTQLILPMVDRLLKAAGLTIAELDALSYARGPGAFTGVRIAAGVVQGLSYANDLPVLPVSTLAAIAAGMYQKLGSEHVLAAIDARMGEVYWAGYEISEGVVRPITAEVVSKVENLPSVAEKDWAGAGTGWAEYKDQLQQKYQVADNCIDTQMLPSAENIVRIAAEDFRHGKQVTAHQAQPVYLRDNVAKKKQNQ